MARIAVTFQNKKYKTQIRNRCKICARARGFIGFFKLCRICVRNLCVAGAIPGITKSSW